MRTDRLRNPLTYIHMLLRIIHTVLPAAYVVHRYVHRSVTPVLLACSPTRGLLMLCSATCSRWRTPPEALLPKLLASVES